jgi:hypothetical protein
MPDDDYGTISVAFQRVRSLVGKQGIGWRKQRTDIVGDLGRRRIRRCSNRESAAPAAEYAQKDKHSRINQLPHSLFSITTTLYLKTYHGSRINQTRSDLSDEKDVTDILTTLLPTSFSSLPNTLRPAHRPSPLIM